MSTATPPPSHQGRGATKKKKTVLPPGECSPISPVASQAHSRARARPMLAHEFQAARAEIGVSQRVMGELLELSGDTPDRTIRQWEAGRSPIPGPVKLAVQGLVRLARRRKKRQSD